MLRVVEAWVPIAFEAFQEYRQGSASFSKSALDVVKKLVRGEHVRREDTSLSQREWSEMMVTLELNCSEL